MRYAVAILMFATAACNGVATRTGGCLQSVHDAISKAGVQPSHITSMTVEADRSSGEDGHLLGYNYWLRVDQCESGYLVVDTDFACRVTQVYTSGACQIPGIRR